MPQTSLAVELREEAVAAREEEDADEFTADHAASSLAGFQRGTLRARDENAHHDTPQGTPQDTPLDPTAREAARTAGPKEPTAHRTDQLDTPGEAASTTATNDPPGAAPGPAGTRTPQGRPVAARTPHTDRS